MGIGERESRRGWGQQLVVRGQLHSPMVKLVMRVAHVAPIRARCFNSKRTSFHVALELEHVESVDLRSAIRKADAVLPRLQCGAARAGVRRGRGECVELAHLAPRLHDWFYARHAEKCPFSAGVGTNGWLAMWGQTRAGRCGYTVFLRRSRNRLFGSRGLTRCGSVRSWRTWRRAFTTGFTLDMLKNGRFLRGLGRKAGSQCDGKAESTYPLGDPPPP